MTGLSLCSWLGLLRDERWGETRRQPTAEPYRAPQKINEAAGSSLKDVPHWVIRGRTNCKGIRGGCSSSSISVKVFSYNEKISLMVYEIVCSECDLPAQIQQ